MFADRKEVNESPEMTREWEFSVNKSASVVRSYKWRWNVRSLYLCQYLLVVWVSVRAGARLAVLWSANSGVAEEARSTLLAELTLCVMQAALEGETHSLECLEICPSHRGTINQKPISVVRLCSSYCANASLRVAGVRVAIAVTELTLTKV